MASSKLTLIRDVFRKSVSNGGFNKTFQSLNITKASEKLIEAEITVTKDMCNMVGFMHGGAISTIADIVSSMGVICNTDGKQGGLSVNLSVNFLKAARPGDQLLFNSEIVKMGKSLTFLDVKVRDKQSGDILATAVQVQHLFQSNF